MRQKSVSLPPKAGELASLHAVPWHDKICFCHITMTVSNLVLKKFTSPGKNIFNYDQIYGFIALDCNTKLNQVSN